MHRTKAAFWLVTAITAAVHLYVAFNDSYWNLFPGADKALHVLWGLFFYLLCRVQLAWRPRDALYAAIAVAIVFEAFEMIDDVIRWNPNWPWHSIDIFYWDGVFDIVANAIGALLGLGLVRSIPGKERQAPRRLLIEILVGCAPLALLGVFYGSNEIAITWILAITFLALVRHARAVRRAAKT